LISGITTSLAQWQSVFNFVAGNSESTLTSISIAWATPTANEYAAGEINYNALPIKASDFKDPSSGESYVMWATTKNNGKYELSTSMEQWAGERVAKLVWNYNPRSTGKTNNISVATWSESSITLTDTQLVNFFALWDTVTDGTKNNILITRISSDGTTITLSTGATIGATALNLEANETAGLIDADEGTWTWTDWIITDWGTANLPY